MKRSILFLFLLCVFSSLYARSVEVYPVKMSYNKIFTDKNGVKTQTVISDDGYEISVGAQLDNNRLKYYVDMQNLYSKDFLLKQDCIQVYSGNYDTDTWTLMNINPAYLNITSGGISSPNTTPNTESEFSAEDACLFVGGTLLCGLFLLDLCDDDNEDDFHVIDNKHSRFVDSPKSFYHTDNSYPWLSIWLFDDRDDYYSVNQSQGLTLNSSKVTSDSYSVEFSVDAGSGPDYKMRVTISDNEYIDYYFMRTDRNNVVNPWADRTYGRNSFLFSMEVSNFNHLGAYYIYSGQPVGWYFGSIFGITDNSVKTLGTAFNHDFNNVIMESYAPYPDNYNYSDYYKYKFEKSEIYKEWSFNMSTGMTFKTAPHVWLMLGCGIDLFDYKWYGDFYWKSSSDNINWTDWQELESGWLAEDSVYPFCTPLIGFNVIFNWIDLAATFEYVIQKGPRFNAMLGFAL
ncbi:MAG: hypothetical protein K5829_11605 [Treponema sp.]|nr:hypothetical protein [Treponema sp.]